MEDLVGLTSLFAGLFFLVALLGFAKVDRTNTTKRELSICAGLMALNYIIGGFWTLGGGLTSFVKSPETFLSLVAVTTGLKLGVILISMLIVVRLYNRDRRGEYEQD